MFSVLKSRWSLFFWIGTFLSVFFLGWHSKSVLVENAELKRVKAELEATNKSLVIYRENTDKLNRRLTEALKELEDEEDTTCDSPIPSCLSRGFERLQRTR